MRVIKMATKLYNMSKDTLLFMWNFHFSGNKGALSLRLRIVSMPPLGCLLLVGSLIRKYMRLHLCILTYA